jgi:tetratricopeptide (TPR) repeat protein
MGRALMALGREEEAQSYMEKYRKVRPQDIPGIRKRFGMIELATLSATEQREREIEHFRKEAREHPDHPDYQLHLSSLLLADRQKEQALQEFRRLLGLNATSQVWEQAGSLLLSSGDYALAREFLERAAVDRPSARLDLAMAILQVDGPEPALQFLDKIPAAEFTGDAATLESQRPGGGRAQRGSGKTLDQGLSQGVHAAPGGAAGGFCYSFGSTENRMG